MPDYSDKQKPMPWVAFKMMSLIMNIRKHFRNIKEEINLTGIKKGDYILDFGCGLGFNTIPAAQKVGGQGRVYALDVSPQAIEVVKKKARKNDLYNIITILSDSNTNLEDDSIDVVYLHNTLPLIKDKQRALDEMSRVLKVGGRLSYMSRFISCAAGGDSMSDDKLKDILLANNRYTLIADNNGHLMFEKMK